MGRVLEAFRAWKTTGSGLGKMGTPGDQTAGMEMGLGIGGMGMMGGAIWGIEEGR